MSSPSPPNAAPGWYPDPSHPGGQRHWDGSRWSEPHAGAVVSPPPQPSSAHNGKKMGCLMTALVVSVGALVLLAVLGLFVAVVADRDETTDEPAEAVDTASTTTDSTATTGSESTESTAAPSATSPPSTLVGLNAPARDGQFQFVVSGIECGATTLGGDVINTEAQGQFCLVSMTVKNVGDEARVFDAGWQKATSATGASYSADSGASVYANEDGRAFLEGINPGNQVTGVVVFDIPPDGDIASLELHDSFLSRGVTVTP